MVLRPHERRPTGDQAVPRHGDDERDPGWDCNVGSDFGRPVFEIAAYRVSPAEWDREHDKARSKFSEMLGGEPREGRSQKAWGERLGRLLEEEHNRVGCFAYGQVIGWIRVLHDGPGAVLKGYVYALPQSRFVRRFQQGRFHNAGKEFELWISDEMLAEGAPEIVPALREEIVATATRGRVFAGRYLDMAAFDAVAPNVNWRGLLQG
jgi:hypothetical protein